MGYSAISELPEQVKSKLPNEAQQIYMTAFNSATSDGMTENKAQEVAWSSVKNSYEQDESGNWHHKPEGGAGSTNTGTMPGN
jgi:cation transport regulator